MPSLTLAPWSPFPAPQSPPPSPRPRPVASARKAAGRWPPPTPPAGGGRRPSLQRNRAFGFAECSVPSAGGTKPRPMPSSTPCVHRWPEPSLAPTDAFIDACVFSLHPLPIFYFLFSP
jgi:hypothetical protein